MWIDLRARRKGTPLLRAIVCVCLAVLSSLLTGCSKSRFESTVTGTVKLDGASIGPGIIQFVPLGNSHNPATGAIQVDGTYQLNTSNEIGLEPGEYRATVAIYDQPTLAPGERAALGSAVLKTPEKYLSVETTDLKFTVAPGENTIPVELTSK
jgi:hypothetical protein